MPNSLELNKINYLKWKKINNFNLGSCRRNFSSKENEKSFIIKNWDDYKFEVVSMSWNAISESFNSLYNEELKKFKYDILVIQFKIKLKDGGYRSFSNLQMDYITNCYIILQRFKIFWSLKQDDYEISDDISHIFYVYKILSSDSPVILKKHKHKQKVDKEIYSSYVLPNTMNYSSWGELVFSSKKKSYSKKKRSVRRFNFFYWKRWNSG